MNKVYCLLLNFIFFSCMITSFDLVAFDNSLIQVYSVNDIGTSSTPLRTRMPLTVAGGSIFGTAFSVNPQNLGGQPYGIIAGGSVSALTLNFSEPNTSSGSFVTQPGGISAGGNVNIGTGLVSTFSNGNQINGPISSGGNFSGSNYAISGNVSVSGTYSGTNTVSGSISQGVPYTAPLNFSDVNSYFSNASNYYKGLSQNVTSTSTGGTTTIMANQGINVVNMTLAQLISNPALKIGVSTTANQENTYVVINVSGSGTNTLSNFLLTSFTSNEDYFNAKGSQILLNFDSNITNLTIGAGSNPTLRILPSILALNTNLTFNGVSGSGGSNTFLGGSLIANNIFTTTASNNAGVFFDENVSQSALVKNAFIGFALDAPAFVTPEPSTWLLLGSGLASIALLKRRKFSLTTK